jgi:hypothetical protein
MTITLNGSTGITNDGGYTGDGVVFADTTPSNTLVTTTGGNVGIGTASPTTKLDVIGGSVSATGPSSGSFGLSLLTTRASASARSWAIKTNENAEGDFVVLRSTTNTNAPSATSLTIDSSGNLLVGTTSLSLTNSNSFYYVTSSAANFISQHANGTASGSAYAVYAYNGGVIGSITQNGTTGVLYNLTSDYRLKNNPIPLTGSSEFIMALQPKKWQWWDGSGEGVGFIAHEFMEVAKYSGNGEKDAVDAEGKPIMQSIQPSSSEVMANLVSFIQEQQAIITEQSLALQDLKSRIEALEVSGANASGTSVTQEQV